MPTFAPAEAEICTASLIASREVRVLRAGFAVFHSPGWDDCQCGQTSIMSKFNKC